MIEIAGYGYGWREAAAIALALSIVGTVTWVRFYRHR
jgi:hypothetical protein